MSAVISEATDVLVFIAEDPLNCVAIGTGQVLHHLDIYRKQAESR